MISKPMNYGKTWSAYDNDTTSHFNQYEYLSSLPKARALAIESSTMDELQNDPREFPRYYAIDAKWIEKWLAYM